MIKAIETVYKGFRFRSRLEARYAVFFDTLGVEWEYEKEGFELDGGIRYLPDFWLPELKLWYEVKGELTWLEKEYWNKWTHTISPELELADKFRDSQEWPVACSVGQIGNHRIYFYAWDLTDSSGGNYFDDESEWVVSNGIATLHVNPGRSDRMIISDNLMGINLPHFTYAWKYGCDTVPINKAIAAARSARFEHGEKPR